jgi:hypothetical protein
MKAAPAIEGPGAANLPKPCAHCGKADRGVRLSYGVHWLHEACESGYIKAQTAGFGSAPQPDPEPAPSPAPTIDLVTDPSIAQITVLAKAGPLTKRLWIDADGKVASDSSQCSLGRGKAVRCDVPTISDLAQLIDRLESHHALTMGSLRPNLPNLVEVTTKDALDGSTAIDLIARTQDYLIYRKGVPAYVMLDFDRKGMPAAVKERISKMGGFVAAVTTLVPEIAHTARLLRPSTSSGLYRCDTGERFEDSGGLHLYIEIADGADAQRFVKTLHARAWLAGLGWMMVGRAAQMLERSIVDRSTAGPEHLCFEGPPVLVAPLAQDAAGRACVVTLGEGLDTTTACPSLTAEEAAQYSRRVTCAKCDPALIAEQSPKCARLTSPRRAKSSPAASKASSPPTTSCYFTTLRSAPRPWPKCWTTLTHM